MTGIYLPTLWETVKKELFEDDLETFSDIFADVDETFNYEQEIIAQTPDDYIIYNLEHITQQMEE